MNRFVYLSPLVVALVAAGCVEPPTEAFRQPPPLRATLDVEDALRGIVNTFRVRDAPPNSAVRLFATTQPPGGPAPCFQFGGGACLDIPGPMRRVWTLGEQTTDATGTAEFPVRVPRGVSGTAHMQALGFVDGAFWSTQVVVPTFIDAGGDADGDGLTNADEVVWGTDLRASDTDGDGLTDADEVMGSTDPLSADSDGGGVDDGTEATAGTDPLDGSDDVPGPLPLCPAPLALEEGTLVDTTFSMEVWTSEDSDAGGCHGGPGGDATLRFTPPTPGLWRIHTESWVGTVLSVRTDCGDVGTEVACHEPAVASDAAELWLDLDGSPVTLLVERRAGNGPTAIVVHATPALPPAPPTLDGVDAWCGDALGIELSGTPGDAPLALAHFTARSATGELTTWSADLLGDQLTQTLALPPLTVEVDAEIEDRAGLRSATVTTACQIPPLRALGETCDPDRVFDRCDTGDCAAGICSVVVAPTLLSVSATANDDLDRLGLQILGTDPDLDVTSVRVTLLDPTLAPLSVVEADLQILGLDPFVGIVVAELAMAIPHAVSVEVVDAAGLASNPMVVVVDAPLALEDGSSCDVTETFGQCPADCVPDGAPDGPATCTVADADCPAGWVQDMPVPSGTDLWSLTGDTQHEPWLTPGGTCGGAGSQVVTSFTATTGGLYRATLTPDAAGATGLLQVRSHCGSPTSLRELSCDTAPRLLDLAAGQTVHFIISGRSPLTVDGSLGAFTLTLAREL